MVTRTRSWSLVVAVLAVVACGGPTPPVTPPGTPEPTDPNAGVGPRPECTAPRAAAGEEIPAEQRGFRALAAQDVDALAGKTVFAGVIEAPEGRERIVIGEPLTLCGPEAGAPGSVSVMNNAGQEIAVPTAHLSKAPLKLNLRAPGSAEQLLLAASDEVDALAKASDEAGPGKADVAAGLEHLVNALVRGGRAKDQLVSEGGWAAQASDPSILAWLEKGVAEGADKARFEQLAACVSQKAILLGATVQGAPSAAAPPLPACRGTGP